MSNQADKSMANLKEITGQLLTIVRAARQIPPGPSHFALATQASELVLVQQGPHLASLGQPLVQSRTRGRCVDGDALEKGKGKVREVEPEPEKEKEMEKPKEEQEKPCRKRPFSWMSKPLPKSVMKMPKRGKSGQEWKSRELVDSSDEEEEEDGLSKWCSPVLTHPLPEMFPARVRLQAMDWRQFKSAYEAIEGHVPVDIICTFHAFLEFCYIVQKNAITEHTLEKLQDAVSHFHHYCKIFLEKSKHIKAVKALGQMLVTNQRLDKLTAARVNFTSHGMLNGTCLSAALEALLQQDGPSHHAPANDAMDNAQDENLDVSVPEDDIDEMKHAHTVLALTEELNIPRLPEMTCPDDPRDASEIPITGCPRYEGKISVFNSACSQFYAPSDLSGIGGMHIEHICACPMWRNEAPRYDCVFINIGSEDVGIRGLEVARIHMFFLFNYGGITYPCAVMRWFNIIGDSPDEHTGMWMVHLACSTNNAPIYNIIHVDSIYHAAHLIPVYGR
ncbi:uncharacterized protein EDB91DRAFT_1086650 [Suillus paluster]|uniref:uncharacterized protein n=1 Tax=Suillus paluster TaxID=48578 RepID=UPI001B886CBD|nr:uncharacterized protein EDB91DRAFT_1086650 [Suillus paluster]KAG1726795.1 hypothetical protein EDB91DRAFT_1086650 [Suillus paluster]